MDLTGIGILLEREKDFKVICIRVFHMLDGRQKLGKKESKHKKGWWRGAWGAQLVKPLSPA